MEHSSSIRAWLVACGVAVLLSGCMKETGETILLPVRPTAVPESVLPPSLRQAIGEYIPLHEGDTPPDIEGCYLAAPMQLLHSSDGLAPQFHDLGFRIGHLSGRNRTGFRHREWDVVGSGGDAWVVGSGAAFTLWTIEEAGNASAGWRYETLTIVSGRKVANGIADCRICVVMRQRQADTQGALASEGTWRVFADGNGLAQKTEDWL